MKSILLITNIFPKPGLRLLNNTSVCYYFAREWVQMGYDVKVIYNYNIYMAPLHWFSFFFEKKIASRFATVINKKRILSKEEYVLDGISVVLLPCYKMFPRIAFSDKVIRKQVERIVEDNKCKSYFPELILGHFLHPSIEILNQLKDIYRVPIGIVLHGNIDAKNVHDINSIRQYKRNIDIWGFRSYPIKETFEKVFGSMKSSFICSSGVPANFIVPESYKKMSVGLSNFIYVGALIKRKHPVSVLQALKKVYNDNSFQLIIIGSGDEYKHLLNESIRLGIQNRIFLKGQMERNQIAKELFDAECFIMISEAETFGLVYLEAMANGCITIASKSEGMDGIIVNGENGFLCKAGDFKELSSIINIIKGLSVEEKKRISKNAIKTASELTDRKAAEYYIKEVFYLIEKNNKQTL